MSLNDKQRVFFCYTGLPFFFELFVSCLHGIRETSTAVGRKKKKKKKERKKRDESDVDLWRECRAVCADHLSCLESANVQYITRWLSCAFAADGLFFSRARLAQSRYSLVVTRPDPSVPRHH